VTRRVIRDMPAGADEADGTAAAGVEYEDIHAWSAGPVRRVPVLHDKGLAMPAELDIVQQMPAVVVTGILQHGLAFPGWPFCRPAKIVIKCDDHAVLETWQEELQHLAGAPKRSQSR
jgi:hypothetical protein